MEVTAVIMVLEAVEAHHLVLFVEWVLDNHCIIRTLYQTWQIHASKAFIPDGLIQMSIFHLFDSSLHIFEMLKMYILLTEKIRYKLGYKMKK